MLISYTVKSRVKYLAQELAFTLGWNFRNCGMTLLHNMQEQKLQHLSTSCTISSSPSLDVRWARIAHGLFRCRDWYKVFSMVVNKYLDIILSFFLCSRYTVKDNTKSHVPSIELIFKLSIMPLILVWNLSLKSGWMSLLLLCSSVTCLFGYFCAISAASSAPVAPPPITNTLSLVFI